MSDQETEPELGDLEVAADMIMKAGQELSLLRDAVVGRDLRPLAARSLRQIIESACRQLDEAFERVQTVRRRGREP